MNISIMNGFTWKNRTSTNKFIDLPTHFTVGLSGLQTELRTDTLQGNMGKSSCFHGEIFLF